MFKKIVMFVFAFGCFSIHAHEEMKVETLHKVIDGMADEAKGKDGISEFIYNGVRMYLISDQQHDRMRLVAPVANVDELTPEHHQNMMIANYHSALDARYAVNNGLVVSVYVHPLKELTQNQLISAVKQVSTLALSFGSQYTSGLLDFQRSAAN